MLFATSSNGHIAILTYSFIILAISSKSSSLKVPYSSANFLKIISFYVNVPVLSVRRYYILPKLSGIFELRVIVPSIR